MRLPTMIVAATLGLVESLPGALLLGGVTDWLVVVAAVAGVATLAGGMAGIVTRAWTGPALVAAGQLVFAAVVASRIVAEWRETPTLGADPGTLVLLGVALAIFAGVAFAALLCAWSRQAALAVVGAAVFLGVGTAAAGAAVRVTGADCDAFRVDPAWQGATWEDRLQLQRTIARCGTLVGDTRAQVRALLGPTNGSLRIDYGPDDRVRRAWVEAYPD